MLVGNGHGALGMGHWAWGIGNNSFPFSPLPIPTIKYLLSTIHADTIY
ncbi:MAG: hypothetical protein ICV85_11510 [Tolypothrix sp. T3-bin4]|nr:hypothetical protein [Tolypothrix sp. T3-bin4]